MYYYFILLLFLTIAQADDQLTIQNAPDDDGQLFSVEGKISIRPEMQAKPNWFVETKVLLDYGKYAGFVRHDGSFKVYDVPSGSYILEVANADFLFEPLRVDITNKGKIRARKLNLLQPNTVVTVPYPVQITVRQPHKYFRKREEWRVTDVLMNPMIIMLGVAFLLMVITPKLAAQDPQMQKEMQNLQLPKVDMPDMADMLANMFGSNKKGAKKPTTSQQARRSIRQN